MDTLSYNLPSLTCELSIVCAKNIEFLPPGTLFVRCFLVGKNGKRIRLNSREISATCDPHWNEHITLECCSSAADPTKELSHQIVVFELRWRCTSVVIGRIVGSKLLGRTEIAWLDVLRSMDMSMEKWVTLVTPRHVVVSLKPPALLVGMKVSASKKAEKLNSKMPVGSMRWKECNCRHCECYGADDDIFTLAAVVEGI